MKSDVRNEKIKEKTNAIRTLEQKKIPFKFHDYSSTGAISGVEVAAALGEPVEKVLKTLVTVGKSNAHYVFVIPVAQELDLKKAAKAANEKNIEMVKSKELLPLTGYVHGGCSPVGMKKLFPTFIDQSAIDKETIIVSGGKIGFQIELSPADLKKIVPFCFSPLTV